MFIAELQDFESLGEGKLNLSTLRTGIMAGTSWPTKTMREVIDILGMEEVGICYGMTETSSVSIRTLPDDPLDKRVETVGRPGPHIEVKIINPDTGEVLPRGEQGEICRAGIP